MNAEQKSIHSRALKARERFRDFEFELIKILQDVDRTKLHRAMGKPSVYAYAVEILGFTESVAYMFIAVARKAREVPEILDSGLSVFKSSRLVSTINRSNAGDLIRFAKGATTRELDQELARRNPKARPERVKMLSEEFLELNIRVSKEFLVKLRRVEALRAQKNDSAGVGPAFEAGLDEYLRRHDPVQKAQRAEWRKAKTEKQRIRERATDGPRPTANSGTSEDSQLCAHRVGEAKALTIRIPLTAAQRHAVFARDGGRCTHVDAEGQRCREDRWIAIHHIHEVARGGSNEAGNLTTLCSAHHDLVHQLSLPIEGQVTWLREPGRQYA